MKYLKLIGFFFASLMLSQSCVVYKSKPISVEEASGYENTKMKIVTKDGNKYKLKRIEKRGGNIETVNKIKEVSIPIRDIKHIKTVDHEPTLISLDSACNHNGVLEVIAENIHGNIYSKKLIKIKRDDDMIIGNKIIKKDTATVVIPISQIEKIQLKNKGLSILGNIGIGIGAIVIFFAIVVVSYAAL